MHFHAVCWHKDTPATKLYNFYIKCHSNSESYDQHCFFWNQVQGWYFFLKNINFLCFYSTVYAILLQIGVCRKFNHFWVIFWNKNSTCVNVLTFWIRKGVKKNDSVIMIIPGRGGGDGFRGWWSHLLSFFFQCSKPCWLALLSPKTNFVII